MTSPTPLPEVFGKYRVLRLLGQGGMGAVHLAHDTQLDRLVALKIPHATGGPGAAGVLQRFWQEAQAAAALHHPNFCPVYEAGETGGVPFLAMAYVEGEPLSHRIQDGRGWLVPQAVRLVARLARALEEAHRRGVVHRDLKPANIMIDRRGEPIIMDFGLARRADHPSRLTRVGALLGTPAYMAPEQVSGDASAGPAADIYSLGVILFELLTGCRPFQGPPAAVLGQVLRAEPPRPSDLRPDLDPRLGSLCLKAMAKEAGDRFATMAEFAAALAGYLRGRPSPPAVAKSPALAGRPGPAAATVGPRPRAAAPTMVAFEGIGGDSSPSAGHRRAPGRSRVLAGMACGLIGVVALFGLALLTSGRPRDTDQTASAGGEPLLPDSGQLSAPPRRVGELPAPPVETPVQPVKSTARPGKETAPPEKTPAPPVPEKSPDTAEKIAPPTPTPVPAGSREHVGEVRRFAHADRVVSVAFSADGRRILSGGGGRRAANGKHVPGSDFSVRLWDAETGRALHRWDEHTSYVWGVALSPDGRQAITGGEAVRVWATGSGAELPGLAGPEASCRAMRLSGDGRRLLTAGGSALRVWDLERQRVLYSLHWRGLPINDAALSGDGCRALFGSEDRTVRLVDVDTGREVCCLRGHTDYLVAVALSADGKLALSSGRDGTVRLWDLQTRRELRRLEGHTSVVQALAFSPDGRRALSGASLQYRKGSWSKGSDHTLRLWDVVSGREVHRFGGHTNAIFGVAFSPDGLRAASASWDGTVRLWRLPPAD